MLKFWVYFCVFFAVVDVAFGIYDLSIGATGYATFEFVMAIFMVCMGAFNYSMLDEY